MAFCPMNMKPCIDDLCRASLTCFDCQESMMVECDGCGKLVAADGSDSDLCECEPDWEDDE